MSRAARKRALTAESSSRWAGAITRTSEDQCSSPSGTCARSRRACGRGSGGSRRGPPSPRAGRRPGPAGTRPRPSGTPRTIRLKVAEGPAGPPRAAAGGGAGIGDAGRAGAAAQARLNLAAAGLTEDQWRAAVGGRPPVPDRRRRGGQGVGQRDDPVQPRRGLAGTQAPRPAGSPGEPAARPVPAVVPGRLRLPRR